MGFIRIIIGLDVAISACIPKRIIDLAATLQGGDTKLNNDKVLHLCFIGFIKELPNGSLVYTFAEICFASDHVVDQVYEKFTESTTCRYCESLSRWPTE
jgi:hypothetical protein